MIAIKNGITPILKRRGVTGYALATKLGKHPSYIYRLMKQELLPSGMTISTLVGIADALNVSIDELIDRK